MSSSGFRDGLGERDLAFDRQTGHVWERLLLRAELSAFEAALRRRVARLALLEDPRLVPLHTLERDPVSSRVVVIAQHVSGVRLSDLLRAAREREVIPDFTVAILLTAEILASVHALHAASNFAHGALSADRIIVAPSGAVSLADYAYAEVLEAARFSPRRLWEQFGVAHWLGEPFSEGADVRHAAMVAIALTLGRPIDHEDLPRALNPLLEEVQEAAMIRGGRLFAEPVAGWMTRALATGAPGGFDSAAEAATACAELLTERERDAARRALLQFLEDVTSPDEEARLEEEEAPRAAEPAPAAPPPIEIVPPQRTVWAAPAPVEAAPAQPAPAPAKTAAASAPAASSSLAAPAPPRDTPPAAEPAPEPVKVVAAAPEPPPPPPPPVAVPEPVHEPVFEPLAPAAPEPAAPASAAAQVESAREPEPVQATPAEPATAPEEIVVSPAAPAPAAAPAAAPSKKHKKHKRDRRREHEEERAVRPNETVTTWPPPPVSVFDTHQGRGTQVVSPSPFAALENAPVVSQPFVPPPEPPPPSPPPAAAPIPFSPVPVLAPPAPAAPPAAPQVAFSPATPVVPAAPPAPAPAPATVPIRLAPPPPVMQPTAAPIEPAQAPGIRLKNRLAPKRSRAESGLHLSSYETPPAEQQDQTAQFRKFWKFVAAGIAVLVAGLAAANLDWSSADAVAAPGLLVIETTPAGSEVFIDGKAHGKTPTEVEVEPGTHEVKLTRNGASHAWSVNVVSGARRVEKLNWSALQQTGGIEVVTNAPGAKVLVDGQQRGETPLTVTDLPPGRHTVVVQGSSGSARRTVTVAAGKTVRLDFEIYSGWVVVSAPIELQVAQKGAIIGTAGDGPLVLPAGRQTIELINEPLGYRASYTVDIKPGEEERLTVTPTGSVSVNAIPWAEVFVDGTRLGETPLANAQVPLGAREIVFRHPQYGERRVTTTISAAEPAQVSVDFTKPQ